MWKEVNNIFMNRTRKLHRAIFKKMKNTDLVVIKSVGVVLVLVFVGVDGPAFRTLEYVPLPPRSVPVTVLQ